MMYINNSDVNEGGMIHRSVVDSEVDGVVECKEGCLRLKRDIDQIECWTDQRQS